MNRSTLAFPATATITTAINTAACTTPPRSSHHA